MALIKNLKGIVFVFTILLENILAQNVTAPSIGPGPTPPIAGQTDANATGGQVGAVAPPAGVPAGPAPIPPAGVAVAPSPTPAVVVPAGPVPAPAGPAPIPPAGVPVGAPLESTTPSNTGPTIKLPELPGIPVPTDIPELPTALPTIPPSARPGGVIQTIATIIRNKLLLLQCMKRPSSPVCNPPVG